MPVVDAGELRAVEAVFEGVTHERVRELGIDAIRLWRRRMAAQNATSRLVDRRDIGKAVADVLLSERPAVQVARGRALGEALEYQLLSGEPSAFVNFLSWLERAGLAYAMGAIPNALPLWYALSDRGVAFFNATDDHPLLPGHARRVADRCPGLPEGVIALLTDAETCIDHGLLRPAVAVMGVAYEAAVEAVAESLTQQGFLTAALPGSAAARIELLRSNIDRRLPGTQVTDRERRFTVTASYNFADELRRRRNDASHTTPRYAFDDRPEVEEFLVSAYRHLPSLWVMVSP